MGRKRRGGALARIPRLTDRYRRSVERIGLKPGTERYQAVVAVVRALASVEALPAPGDIPAIIPPTRAVFVRRAGAFNLWVWFTWDDEHVSVQAVTAQPPVPID